MRVFRRRTGPALCRMWTRDREDLCGKRQCVRATPTRGETAYRGVPGSTVRRINGAGWGVSSGSVVLIREGRRTGSGRNDDGFSARETAAERCCLTARGRRVDCELSVRTDMKSTVWTAFGRSRRRGFSALRQGLLVASAAGLILFTLISSRQLSLERWVHPEEPELRYLLWV